MTLTFYNVGDAPNVVNKTLGDGVTVNDVHPVENCDMLNPSFILNQSTAANTYNYVYVSAFGRYYFITDRQLLRGNRVLINCAVDVLYTYGTSIKACSGTVLRSESIGAPTLIPDSKLPIQTNKLKVDCDNFALTPFDPVSTTYQFILTTIGGATS